MLATVGENAVEDRSNLERGGVRPEVITSFLAVGEPDVEVPPSRATTLAEDTMAADWALMGDVFDVGPRRIDCFI